MTKPIVIVTGASRGLGKETARQLAKAGADLMLVARGKEALETAALEIRKEAGREVLTYAGDVSDAKQSLQVVRDTVKAFGRLDALVNNAGILEPVENIAEVDPARWRYNMEVNLMGPFYLTHAAIIHLRKTEGRVINISSGAALQAIEGWSAYCVSKAGLTHFTRVLAVEEPKLTSIALRPGVVDTEMQALIRREGRRVMSRERFAYFLKLKEDGRLEPPEVPARSAAWLALHAPRAWSGEMIDYADPKIGSF
ncbi:SDR family NAD(P)-dependent oxidoreductase [Desulforhabdus amnigena]|uniref:Short-chain dehydrogenase n=1 Tax=Desulforhabdus amnigena TaxID=40218 RepID=A0A9W6CUY2_9BACT|nr:SDR family NAD(P)-dependent oxidoreductase [Desulforhabdus amnigena]NLJ27739.1 SDR family NAD(P)-dependent oxidoreductase [Deltaproteobacteria bacterium]GLI32969.1 short-chain dehydrogenase [Desulforhabdus amnigena]